MGLKECKWDLDWLWEVFGKVLDAFSALSYCEFCYEYESANFYSGYQD